MSKLILFQGNSTTAAGRDREDSTSLGSGYASFVAASLGVNSPSDYRFMNCGVPGNQVCDVYARMDRDIISLTPDYMSILTGANDLSRNYMMFNRLNIERYKKIYGMMIEETLEALPNLKIMLFTPFILPHKQLEKTYINCKHFSVESLCAGMVEFVEATVQVAEKYELPCVNLQEKFNEALKMAPVEHWSRDGYHPTPAGHGIIAREWLKLFEEVRRGEN